MSTIALRRYRIWMIFLTFINGLVMAGFYGYSLYAWFTHLPSTWELRATADTYNLIGIAAPRQILPRPYALYWQEWSNIVTAGVIFIISIIALISHYNLPKYFRALLVAIPVGLSLYVNIDYIAFVMGLKSVRSPLNCLSTNVLCYLSWSSRFLAIITDAFVLVEIGLTLRWGPLRPKKDVVVDDEVLVEQVPVQTSQPPLQTGHDSEDTGAGTNSPLQMTQV
ncbi:hypothetical protein BKA57DRAFT_448556 [Linnemannia elongata]|nr:hypothetical protein BKA57DRAFT_448556 [Linnemannia elongata]